MAYWTGEYSNPYFSLLNADISDVETLSGTTNNWLNNSYYYYTRYLQALDSDYVLVVGSSRIAVADARGASATATGSWVDTESPSGHNYQWGGLLSIGDIAFVSSNSTLTGIAVWDAKLFAIILNCSVQFLEATLSATWIYTVICFLSVIIIMVCVYMN
ncbi:MAG: hypothetical protein H7A34_04655 [bacterium]|nr:hypothetical protein [bacterium]